MSYKAISCSSDENVGSCLRPLAEAGYSVIARPKGEQREWNPALYIRISNYVISELANCFTRAALSITFR